jgi:transposase
MESDQAALTVCQAEAERWPTACVRPSCADGHSVRAADGLSLGISAARDGLWLRHDLLAPATRLARSGRVGKNLATVARRVRTGRQNRLVEGRHGQLLGARHFWGARTGPNPTDRGKNGSKRHVVCDRAGTPLAVEHTGANVHDSQQAIPLIDAIPAIKQPRGGRRKRPDQAYADAAYDAEAKIRKPLRQRGIAPFIAKRGREHGSGLGKHRCVVEGVFAWLFNYRRLRVRYEKRDDIHSAFLILGCLLICWNRVQGFC